MAEWFKGYRDNSGKHQADYERLDAALVPQSGPCETLHGELLRAIGRIGHDYYNNGWGCNNWSGALEFLSEYGPIRAKDYRFLAQYSRGQSYPDSPTQYTVEDKACQIIERITNEIVEEALESERVGFSTSPCDMFSLQQKDAPFVDEDESEAA